MSLSVGVEIEGIALRRATSAAPFPNQHDKQLHIVADAMRNAGLQCRVYLPSSTRGSGPDYSVWNVAMDISIVEQTSGSSEDQDTAFRSRFGFEIISPVFKNVVNDQVWESLLKSGVDSVSSAIV